MRGAAVETQEERLLQLALGMVAQEGGKPVPPTHVLVPLAGGRGVMLPLGQGRLSWEAAQVYLPYRLAGRLQVAVAAGAATTGLALPGCRLLRLEAEGSLLWRLCARYWQEPFHFAAYTGIAWAGRKWTVRVMDRTGSVLAYAKVAATPLAKRLVRNEQARLAELAGIPGLAGRVPEAIGLWEEGGISVLLLSPLEGRRVPPRFSGDVRAFLELLPSRGRVRLGDHPLFAELDAAVAGTEHEEAWVRQRERLAELEVTWAYQHGDFAPWNLRRTEGGLAAFDWEAARPDGVRELDEMHWRHMVAQAFGRRGQGTAVAEVLYSFYAALLFPRVGKGGEESGAA